MQSEQQYNFKDIRKIHTADELVNIVLSKTQRKTPTLLHGGVDIGRARAFYMRKVKFCGGDIHERLDEITQKFPKLDDVHPFYADLINVVVDRDHYKLALGHINSTRGLIDKIAKDYVRLLKYADSHYRCKMLKKAALGR
jgi:nucleolar GTP-binding protein